ncbi:MAG: tagaturonate reductase [Erysipelotrichaceae bacterium]|nr:tagaturonate reductase [Erysipelotrichaceae bacterium]
MEIINSKIVPVVERPVKVIQFGEGNFLRGFVEYFIDLANEKTDFNGNVVLIKSTPRGNLDKYKDQDCLYTLQLRGLVEGKKYVETRVITCCSDAVSVYLDYDRYIALAKEPELRFVVSNTTEAGIVFSADDEYEEKKNITFPAKLTQFLEARYKAFNGDPEKGLVMLPVELIDDNGQALKKCVNQYIDLWNMDEGFKKWVNESCVFASTLVDRIVTGYPRDEIDQISANLGYNDELLNTAEPFALWVIESEKDISKEFPMDKPLADKPGMDVIFTDNQKPYKQRKVRILNGAHTSFVLASFLMGNDTVKESMEDDLVKQFMLDTLHKEVIPTLSLPKEELEEFADAVVDRFNNPFIKHQLLAISLNSVSKWRARCLPSLLGYLEKYNELPTHLTFSLAALIAFYNGERIVDHVLKGHRFGQVYDIKDDSNVLEFFQANSYLESNKLVHKYLSNTDFHGQDLTEVPGLEDLVVEYLDDIKTNGVRKAMEKL